MIINARSTYQFIKDLLRSNRRLTFTSEAFSHGQGAAVYVNQYSKDEVDKLLNEKLSFPIYEFMIDYMINFGVDWVGGFEIEARLDTEKLYFDVVFTDSNSNYWETYDPIYQNIVIDVHSVLAKALADSDRCSGIEVDALELAISLNMSESKISRLKICVKIVEGFYEGKEEQNEAMALLPEIENIVRGIIESSALEHNAITAAADIADSSYELKIDFAPIFEGVTDYVNHSASAQKSSMTIN
jgi:hypothetical protein